MLSDKLFFIVGAFELKNNLCIYEYVSLYKLLITRRTIDLIVNIACNCFTG